MSVDLSLILPNECYDIWDNSLATKVFYKKIEEIAEGGERRLLRTSVSIIQTLLIGEGSALLRRTQKTQKT